MKKNMRLLAILLLIAMIMPIIGESIYAEDVKVNKIIPKILNGYESRPISNKEYELEGEVEKDCIIEIYNGFDKVATVESKAGRFLVALTLKEGFNNIRAKSLIDGVESNFSESRGLSVDSIGPRIDISHKPTIRDDYKLLEITLEDANKIDRLIVNGKKVDLNENTYREELETVIGENRFKIEAYDSLDNKSEEEYVIVREKKEEIKLDDPDDEVIDIPCIVLKRVALAELGKLIGVNFDHLNRPTDLYVTRKELESLEEIYFEEGNHYDLYDYNVYITTFKGLEYAKNLKKLRLSYNRNLEQGGGIKELINLSNLEYVKLRDNQITSIEALKNNKKINFLECSINKIEDISVISNFKDMENLDFSANKVNDISSIKDLTKIHTLNLSSNNIEDISHLKGLVNIENYLYMSGNKIEDISPITGMTKLKDLEFSRNKVRDIGPLKNLSNLERLWINYNTDIDDISALENLTELKDLGLRGLDKIEDFSPLLNLSKLERIILAETKLEGKEDDLLKAIKLQEKIKDLDIKENNPQLIQNLRDEYNLLDKEVGKLVNIDKLGSEEEDLDLGDEIVVIKDVKFKELLNLSLGKKDVKADITRNEMLSLKEIDARIMPLLEFPKDEEIGKQGPQFRGIRDISGIRYAKNLKKLSLSENLIVDISEVRYLRDLEHLDILRNKVEDISALTDLVNIKYLNIYNNEISDLDPLYKLDKIEFFDCHFNRQKDGIKNINGLRNKPVMNYCNIESNFIVDISPLRDMPLLENVGVGGNQIKDLRPIERLADEYFLNGYFITGAPKERPDLYVGMNFQKDLTEYRYNIGKEDRLEFNIPVKGIEKFVEYGLENFEAQLPVLKKLPDGVEGEIRGNKIIFTFPKATDKLVEYDLSGLGLEYEVYYLALEDFKVSQGREKPKENKGDGNERPVVVPSLPSESLAVTPAEKKLVKDKEREVELELKETLKDLDEARWAIAAINDLCEKNIVKGYKDMTFKPNAKITRAEYATILSRTFDFKNTNDKSNLRDIKESDWFYTDVVKLNSIGIIRGNEKGEFEANRSITREEMITMLIRSIECLNKIENYENNLEKYIDSREISAWALDSMNKARELKLIDGFKDNTLRPCMETSRAEVCMIISRYLINSK